MSSWLPFTRLLPHPLLRRNAPLAPEKRLFRWNRADRAPTDVLTIFFGPKIHEFSDGKWSSVDGISEGGVPDSLTRSRVSLAQAILRVLFWAGVHQTVHHTGAHPCNLNQLNMDAKKSKCLFSNYNYLLQTLPNHHFQYASRISSMKPPSNLGVGRMTSCASSLFRNGNMHIWGHLQSYLVASLQIGSSLPPKLGKTVKLQEYWKPAPRKIGCISWWRRVPKSTKKWTGFGG